MSGQEDDRYLRRLQERRTKQRNLVVGAVVIGGVVLFMILAGSMR